MIVIMVGLPGTGKSTLARRLAVELNGHVVDKDTVRAAMFGPFVDYSQEQDDLSMESVYEAAQYIARRRLVFVDGRAFAFRRQWERALEVARSHGVWRVIETVCADEVARKRLVETGHLAANRNFALYLDLKAGREEVESPKLVVDTGRPLEECVRECLGYLE